MAFLRYPTCFLALIPFLLVSELFAIDGPLPRSFLEIKVTPDDPGWSYKLGETARFNVSVLQSGYPVAGAKVRYEAGPEKMEPTAAGNLTLNENGHAVVDGGTLHEPGFIRLLIEVEWNGNTYKGYGTAGFSPEDIKPWTIMPEDFSSFGRKPLKRREQCRWTPP